MAYQDWEKYHNTKSASGRKTSSARSVSAKSSSNTNRKQHTSNTSTARKTNVSNSHRRKVVRRKKRYKPTSQNTLIMILLATSLTGVMCAGFGSSRSVHSATDIPSTTIPVELNDMTIGSQPVDIVDITNNDTTNNDTTNNDTTNNDTTNNDAEEQLSEEELLDYESYCYVGKYGDKEYLFCPEEYVLQLAEYSIDKLNELYKSSGKMPLLENGECIPDCISPELIAALCFTESSYRVQSVGGLPLGTDRDCSANDRAEGILQQKPAFVADANNYSLRYGGQGYDNKDRYNPLTAMEICITNLTRIYRAYLQKGCDTYNYLGATSPNDNEILGALIVAYNQGEGSMQKWAKLGKLSQMLNFPNSTNNYGAVYYRAVMNNLEDILEDDFTR